MSDADISTMPPKLQQAFQELFAEEFPEAQAAALTTIVERYGEDYIMQWIDRVAAGKFRGDPDVWIDTWMRDILITAIVFMSKAKFKLSRRDACRITAQAFNRRNPDAIVTQLKVKRIAKAHDALLLALETAI